MMEYGHLISLSVFKIFFSTTQPWIYFLCDIDTLNDVCDFFVLICVMSYNSLKNSFMHVTIFFLPNLDLLELLGVFAAICHSNECLDFGILF